MLKPWFLALVYWYCNHIDLSWFKYFLDFHFPKMQSLYLFPISNIQHNWLGHTECSQWWIYFMKNDAVSISVHWYIMKHCWNCNTPTLLQRPLNDSEYNHEPISHNSPNMAYPKINKHCSCFVQFGNHLAPTYLNPYHSGSHQSKQDNGYPSFLFLYL